jgi:rhodanese-related sulfurtransferase
MISISQYLLDNIMLVAVAATSGGLLIWPFLSRRMGGPAISAFEATRLVNHEKAVFLDVGEPAEFNAGHIAGAKHIPFGSLDARLGDLPKDKTAPVIVVCPTGARAGKAASALRNKGYTRAQALAGGMGGWRDAQMPVQKAG